MSFTRQSRSLGRGSGLWEPARSTDWCFIDRLLATLVHLRHGVTHDVPACCLDMCWPVVNALLDDPAD
jgi:hypothetical protein